MLLLGLFLQVSLPGVVVELGGDDGRSEEPVAGQAGLLLSQVGGHQVSWRLHCNEVRGPDHVHAIQICPIQSYLMI